MGLVMIGIIWTFSRAGSADDGSFNRRTPRPAWRFLDRSERRAIDAVSLTSHQWNRIVIHGTGTTIGNASTLDYYHRKVKNLEAGMGYHFLIGNGHASGDGDIEVGTRWIGQQAAEHIDTTGKMVGHPISICLVGNFHETAPTRMQLEALDELIDYLQARLGKLPVAMHNASKDATACPGPNFPVAEFEEPKAGDSVR